MTDNELVEARTTEWVPSTVRKGNCGRTFLVTNDQEFCIEAKKQDDLLQDGTPIEIATLFDGGLAIRKAGG